MIKPFVTTIAGIVFSISVSAQHLEVGMETINPVTGKQLKTHHVIRQVEPGLEYGQKNVAVRISTDSNVQSEFSYVEIRSLLIQKDIDGIEKKFGEPQRIEITPGYEKRMYRKGLKKLIIEMDRLTDQSIKAFRYEQKTKNISRATIVEVRAIKTGKTTMEEITEAFGEPTSIRLTENMEKWIFKMEDASLEIYFDPKLNTVRNFRYRQK